MPDSFTWATADLGVLVSGDPPVSLRYGDHVPSLSGDKPYTTIIALHGAGFNSVIWEPWLPYLPNDIRLIAVNRRGFSGSSAVHQSQELLDGNPEAHGRYVLDTLAFIKFVADELKVPGRDENTGEGGIILLGWSKSCAFVASILALLSSGTALPASHRLPLSLCSPYLAAAHRSLKGIVLFEPPGLVCGIPEDQMLVSPLLTPLSIARGFVESIVASFTEPQRSSVQASVDDNMATYHDLSSWNGVDDAERKEVARKALASVPPSLGVSVIYCAGTTVLTCLHGSKWMINQFLGQPNTTYRIIPGGDHFVMATAPEAFNAAVLSSIRELGQTTLKRKGCE